MLQSRKILVVPSLFALVISIGCVCSTLFFSPTHVVFIVLHYVLMYQVLPKVNRQVWIALVSTSIIAASAYPVFAKNERAGHDLFSSEKPEAVRYRRSGY